MLAIGFGGASAEKRRNRRFATEIRNNSSFVARQKRQSMIFIDGLLIVPMFGMDCYTDILLMQEILQLNVYLLHSSPLIWRRILVHRDTSFFQLHHTLQISMGWQNYHLFEFGFEGYRIGKIDEKEKETGYGSDQVLDCSAVKLGDIVTGPKDVMTYTYDFGDDWQHRIEVEEILPVERSLTYPFCTGGAMACPPEDCGGIHAFYHSLEILRDKKHPDRKAMAQLFPRKFKPEVFDREKVNGELAGLDNYIHKWLNGGQ